MWENAYLSIKNPKASRARLRALDPGHRLLALLARLRFATLATFSLRSCPPNQILDLLLEVGWDRKRRSISLTLDEGSEPVPIDLMQDLP